MVNEQDLGWMTMTWTDVTNGLLTTIMVLPVNLMIMWMFRRSRVVMVCFSLSCFNEDGDPRHEAFPSIQCYILAHTLHHSETLGFFYDHCIFEDH